MQENGQTPSKIQSGITTPIESHPKSSSPQSSASPESSQVLSGTEFPEATNLEEYYISVKKPYGLEYFGIQDDIETYNTYAQDIDDYIKNEIEDNLLENSLKTYRAIIEELMLSMGLDSRLDTVEKFKRVHGWIINIVGPQRLLEENKKKILYDKT